MSKINKFVVTKLVKLSDEFVLGSGTRARHRSGAAITVGTRGNVGSTKSHNSHEPTVYVQVIYDLNVIEVKRFMLDLI